MTPPSSAVPSADPAAPLLGRLENVHPDAATVSRLAFDARCQRWLDALLRHRLVFAHRRLSAVNALVEVESGAGTFLLALDSSQWPALGMALDLADEDSACAVASVLTKPLLDLLSPLIGGARVARRKRMNGCASAIPPTTVIGGSHASVGLRRVESRLSAHLRQSLAQVPAGACHTFAALRIPGRLMLMTRVLPTDTLSRLETGDTVLLDANPAGSAYRLIYGRGMTMEVPTTMNPQDQTLVAQGAPQLADDAQQMPQAHPIDELQVPVSFEIDSARVSLAELASIRPGYVIELDRQVSSALVRLVCHGQTVGQGQLVAVGDQMGVRILRMGLPSAGTGKRA